MLSDQTAWCELRPAAAPVFGQQPSFFQENTRGDAATRLLNHGVEGLTSCENDRPARFAFLSAWAAGESLLTSAKKVVEADRKASYQDMGALRLTDGVLSGL